MTKPFIVVLVIFALIIIVEISILLYKYYKDKKIPSNTPGSNSQPPNKPGGNNQSPGGNNQPSNTPGGNNNPNGNNQPNTPGGNIKPYQPPGGNNNPNGNNQPNTPGGNNQPNPSGGNNNPNGNNQPNTPRGNNNPNGNNQPNPPGGNNQSTTKKCYVACNGSLNFDNIWGKMIYITDIPIMKAKIYKNKPDYYLVKMKNDIMTLEVGNDKGECFINGDKSNPYTGYINPICLSNGIFVSRDEKIIYGFARNPGNPCNLWIFDAVNNSTIPIKDMLLVGDEDPVLDSRINFVFLGDNYAPNSYLLDIDYIDSKKTCPDWEYNCN